MSSRPNSESKLISALINAKDVGQAAVYGVTPEMFVSYQPEYRWLMDYPTSYESQPSPEAIEIKFPEFPYSSSSKDVAFICDEVKDKHLHRGMITAIKGAGDALRNGDTDEAFAFMTSIQHPTYGITRKMKNALHDASFLDNYGEKVDRIPMPWKSLQEATGGIADGDFWVLAARLGQGKSWSLMCALAHALLEGRKVMLFSLEMPERQVMSRIHTILAMEMGMTNVRHTDLKDRSFDPILYRRLLKLIKENIPGELFVVDTSGGSITTAHIASMTKDMDLVVVDHMGLLTSPMGRRAIEDWREMATISNIIKEIAQINKVPIFAAAQINREGDTAGWKPPKVKNLAQSDALGQDADVVITMKQRSKTVAVYSVEKNRDGESGVLFHSRYLPNEGKFPEISFEKARTLVDRDIADVEDQ